MTEEEKRLRRDFRKLLMEIGEDHIENGEALMEYGGDCYTEGRLRMLVGMAMAEISECMAHDDMDTPIGQMLMRLHEIAKMLEREGGVQ